MAIKRPIVLDTTYKGLREIKVGDVTGVGTGGTGLSSVSQYRLLAGNTADSLMEVPVSVISSVNTVDLSFSTNSNIRHISQFGFESISIHSAIAAIVADNVEIVAPDIKVKASDVLSFTPTHDDHVVPKHHLSTVLGGYVPYTGATGKVTFFTPTTAQASIRLPHGGTPTTLENGDIWTTVDSMFLRRNGGTRIIPDTGHASSNTYWRMNSSGVPTYSAIFDNGVEVGVNALKADVTFNIHQIYNVGLGIENDRRVDAPPTINTILNNEQSLPEYILFRINNHHSLALYNQIVSGHGEDKGFVRFYVWNILASALSFTVGTAITSHVSHNFLNGIYVEGAVTMYSLTDKSIDANYSRVLVSNAGGTIAYAAKSGFGMPTGESGQSLRHNGTAWVATSRLKFDVDYNISIPYEAGYFARFIVDGPSNTVPFGVTDDSIYIGDAGYSVYFNSFSTTAGYLYRAANGLISLANPGNLSGTLTANYIPVATAAANTLGNSIIYQDTVNSRIAIGTTSPTYQIHAISPTENNNLYLESQNVGAGRVLIDLKTQHANNPGAYGRFVFRGSDNSFIWTVWDQGINSGVGDWSQAFNYNFRTRKLQFGANPTFAIMDYLNNTFAIGTTTPTEQLHTTGGVRFAGITEVLVAQSNPKVLVQDGDGKLFFQNLTSPGGFANPMTTLGDIIVATTDGVANRLAGITNSGTRKYLSQLKDQPETSIVTSWEQIPYSDISGTPNLSGYHTGVLTANYLPVATDASTLGNSLVYSNSAANAIDSFIIQRKSDSFGVFTVDTLSDTRYARIGINCAPSTAALHIRTFTLSGSAGAGSTIIQETISDNVGGAAILFRKSRGWLNQQEEVDANDVIGGMVGSVYNGTAYSAVLVALRFFVEEKHGSAVPYTYSTSMRFETSIEGTQTEKMRLTAAGFLALNTTTPAERLHVNGNARVDGTFKVVNTSSAKRIEINKDELSADWYRLDENTNGTVFGVMRFFGITNSIGNDGIRAADILFRKTAAWTGSLGGVSIPWEMDIRRHDGNTPETWSSVFKLASSGHLTLPVLAGTGNRNIGVDQYGKLIELTGGGSNWTRVTNDIYYTAGQVSIGVTTFGNALQVKGTQDIVTYLWANASNSTGLQVEHIGSLSEDLTKDLVKIVRSTDCNSYDINSYLVYLSDAPTLGAAKNYGGQIKVRVNSKDCFLMQAHDSANPAFVFNTAVSYGSTHLIAVQNNDVDVFKINHNGSIVTGASLPSFQLTNIDASAPTGTAKWIEFKFNGDVYRIQMTKV